ncbi:MAG: hypothetical protein NC548_12865 [Lachnospiraceae bacterium]|nr:hypothetical protein [Lachnospiraceae bacterium]MCM1230718.1 hypothetical protein [Ruminococcus flavefaciens]
MGEGPSLTVISSYFPTTCWVFPTAGISDGIIVRFSEGFYLKIYYSDKMHDAYNVIGGWNGEVNPRLNITVKDKDIKEWCSKITSSEAFMKVVYENRH